MTEELPLEIFPKYPAEKALLAFNFRRDLARGVTITSLVSIAAVTMGTVVGSANADIVISGSSISGTRAKAYFAGGVGGETYIVSCKVNTSDGQAPLEIHIKIYIKTV